MAETLKKEAYRVAKFKEKDRAVSGGGGFEIQHRKGKAVYQQSYTLRN